MNELFEDAVSAGIALRTELLAGVLFCSTGGLPSMMICFEKDGLMNTPSEFFALTSST